MDEATQGEGEGAVGRTVAAVMCNCQVSQGECLTVSCFAAACGKSQQG